MQLKSWKLEQAHARSPVNVVEGDNVEDDEEEDEVGG